MVRSEADEALTAEIDGVRYLAVIFEPGGVLSW